MVSEEQRPFLAEKTVAAPQHNESQRVEETRVAEATTEADPMEKGKREGSERRDRASFLLTLYKCYAMLRIITPQIDTSAYSSSDCRRVPL